jgi:hypothetical protein
LRRLNPHGLPPRGKASEDWLKEKRGDVLAIIDEEECKGYAVLTTPSNPALISDLYIVILPGYEQIYRIFLRQILTFTLRYRRVHKIALLIPTTEKLAIDAAFDEGFKQEALLDEAIFFDQRYLDVIILGLIVGKNGSVHNN